MATTVAQIRVLGVRQGAEPEEIEIGSDYESLEESLGGGFESYRVAPYLLVYVNNDGTTKPYNRCGFRGDFLVVKISHAGNNISMTDKDLVVAREWLSRNDHRPPLCHICGEPGVFTQFCKCYDVLIFCPRCYNKVFQDSSGLCARCK